MSPPVESASTAQSPAPQVELLEAALRATSWTAQDPASGAWLLGVGDTVRSNVDLGQGYAQADWGMFATLRDDGQSSFVGFGGHEATAIIEVPLPFRDETTAVRVDPTGTRLYMHAGADGHDRGVLVLDAASGRHHAVVEEGTLAADAQRRALIWSRTGETLISTVCDLEACLVDVIDVARDTSRRLAEPFPAVAATDRYLLGQARAGTPWLSLDLATEELRALPLDPDLQASAFIPLDETRLVMDGLRDGSYSIMIVDLRDGSTQVIAMIPANPDPAHRLLRWPVQADRWVMLGPDASVSDTLAATGSLPVLSALDLESGEVLPLEFRLRR